MGYAARLNQGRAAVAEGPPMAEMAVRPYVGRVLLGYPVGFTETTPFATSVRRLVTYEHQKPDPERQLAGTVVAPGLYIEDNRNALAARVLEYPHIQWLWQVDTDIEFKEDVLDKLLNLAESRGLKILNASVPIGETYRTGGFLLGGEDEPGIWKALNHVGPEPIEVDGIATTATLIHREVIEAIADEHGQRWFCRIPVPLSPEGTPKRQQKFSNQGEDFSFCLRAKACGYSIWVAHVIGMRHWKMKGYTHDPPGTWPERSAGG